jgi:hypothetical protein
MIDQLDARIVVLLGRPLALLRFRQHKLLKEELDALIEERVAASR